jgi:hypothetical protein
VQVAQIKAKYKPYKVTALELAIAYGVSQGAIRSIINGDNWGWMGGRIKIKKE